MDVGGMKFRMGAAGWSYFTSSCLYEYLLLTFNILNAGNVGENSNQLCLHLIINSKYSMHPQQCPWAKVIGLAHNYLGTGAPEDAKCLISSSKRPKRVVLTWLR